MKRMWAEYLQRMYAFELSRAVFGWRTKGKEINLRRPRDNIGLLKIDEGA
jgi:hypothetical protein